MRCPSCNAALEPAAGFMQIGIAVIATIPFWVSALGDRAWGEGVLWGLMGLGLVTVAVGGVLWWHTMHFRVLRNDA